VSNSGGSSGGSAGAVLLNTAGLPSGYPQLDANALIQLANLPLSATTTIRSTVGPPVVVAGDNPLDLALDFAACIIYQAPSVLPALGNPWAGTSQGFPGGLTGPIAARYYPGTTGLGAALLMTGNTLYAFGPFVPQAEHAWQGLHLNLTVAGSAGAVIRFGIAADTGVCYPGAYLLDAGTAVATAAANVGVSINDTLPLEPVWLLAAAQGGAATQPTCTTTSPNVTAAAFGAGLPSLTAGNCGYSIAGVAGALAGSFPAGATVLGANQCPYVTLLA
jgi:hypothetical protein